MVTEWSHISPLLQEGFVPGEHEVGHCRRPFPIPPKNPVSSGDAGRVAPCSEDRAGRNVDLVPLHRHSGDTVGAGSWLGGGGEGGWPGGGSEGGWSKGGRDGG